MKRLSSSVGACVLSEPLFVVMASGWTTNRRMCRHFTTVCEPGVCALLDRARRSGDA